jgi:hypothetical protein
MINLIIYAYSRTLSFVVFLFGAFVFWCYNAAFVAVLATDPNDMPVHDLEELLAKSDNYKVGHSPSTTCEIRGRTLLGKKDIYFGGNE